MLFRLEDHYDRLLRSAKLIQLDCPYSKVDFKKAFIDVIKANEYDRKLISSSDLICRWIWFMGIRWTG